MFGYELQLSANLPFAAGVVLIALALTILAFKKMLDLKLGPITIASQQINAQVNNVPVDSSGEYTEPTMRTLVKELHDGAHLQEIKDSIESTKEQSSLHTAMLLDIVRRVTRLEELSKKKEQ